MAVDSNGANNGTNGLVPTATPAAKGTGANPAITQQPRRKRSSSLMKSATSLPTVEHSLEEFIAKANQTLVDVSSWDAANEAAKQEDAQRREQDQQRWKAAETQMRESAAREQSLRRQLDGLQGKLAEAEARAAVAGTQMGSAAHDSTINDLKTQIEKAMQRMRAAEERSAELANELARQKAELNARPASEPMFGGAVDGDAEERVRLAEAKAAKALAAARAAQAGLTVSPADLAAIESGLVVSAPVQKKTPWLPILLAFAGGIAIMFGVWKLVLNKDTKAPVAAASAVEPAAPPAGGAAAKPSVTPIDDGTTPQPAGTEEAKKPADEPKVEPIKGDEPKAEPVKDEPKTEPAAVKDEPKDEPKAEPKDEPKAEPAVEPAKPAAKKATAKAAKKPAAKPAAKKSTKADLADPFADAPAPAKKPAKAEKPAGGIVDPF